MQKLNFLQTSTPLNVDGGQHVLLRSTSTSEDVGSMPPECRFTRPEMQDWRISTEKIKGLHESEEKMMQKLNFLHTSSPPIVRRRGGMKGRTIICAVRCVCLDRGMLPVFVYF